MGKGVSVYDDDVDDVFISNIQPAGKWSLLFPFSFASYL